MEELKVLIADDDAGMRLIMRRIVDKVEGFTLAAEADNGQTALELAESLKPDVVFLDVEMPRMTGVECARAIEDMNPDTILKTCRRYQVTHIFAVPMLWHTIEKKVWANAREQKQEEKLRKMLKFTTGCRMYFPTLAPGLPRIC